MTQQAQSPVTPAMASTDRELMQQAVEMFQAQDLTHWSEAHDRVAITALRDRLARQEQTINLPRAEVVNIQQLLKTLDDGSDDWITETRFGLELHLSDTSPPPAREWVGLTMDDINDMAVTKEWLAGARWAEAKLKERNA